MESLILDKSLEIKNINTWFDLQSSVKESNFGYSGHRLEQNINQFKKQLRNLKEENQFQLYLSTKSDELGESTQNCTINPFKIQKNVIKLGAKRCKTIIRKLGSKPTKLNPEQNTLRNKHNEDNLFSTISEINSKSFDEFQILQENFVSSIKISEPDSIKNYFNQERATSNNTYKIFSVQVLVPSNQFIQKSETLYNLLKENHYSVKV